MKRSRQKAILTLLSQRRITTQKQLCAALLEQGFRVTQATLSRDIAELGLTKSENGYGLPRVSTNEMADAKSIKILSEAVREVDCAENIVVVKALTGMGSAAGAAIDHLHLPEVVGSVAGDDTVIIVVRSAEAAMVLRERLLELLG